MLSPIVQYSLQLVSFIGCLGIVMSDPQRRHLLQVLDGLLMCSGRKTISNLYRQHVSQPDPKNGADFFRESPWDEVGMSRQRKQTLMVQLLNIGQKLGLGQVIKISIDDSLGKKGKATKQLEAVDIQHNHSESSGKKQVYSNGYVYVAVHVHFGPFGFTFDLRLYLRARTIRRLNRERQKSKNGLARLPYRSKYALVHEMLVELAALLPKEYQVYALFDSWYASAKLINFCRRQGWHIICALKSNRRVAKQRVDKHDRLLKHKHYQRITLNATDETGHPRSVAPTYYVRTVTGALEKVKSPVCVIISRRHKGDKRPKYFACSDLTLTAQAALRLYQQRWPVEVDNLYLKEFLGLGDFRLQSLEATTKWFAVVLLDLNFLQQQQAQHFEQTQTIAPLSDFIVQHRQAHLQTLLRTVAEEAIRTGDVEQVVQRFIRPATALN